MNTTPNVFVIGDSISIQYGPYLEKFLAGRLGYARKTGEAEAMLNLDVPQGANGGDTSMVLDFLRALKRAGRRVADVLLINAGLHDIKTDPATGQKQIPLDVYRQNLRAIIPLARELAGELVWIATTPSDDATHNNRPNTTFHRYKADNDAYRQAAAEITAEAGVAVIELFTFTQQLGPDVYCDHIHYHESIRQMQAAYIAGWLIGRYGKST